MAGISNPAFRVICKEFGAGLIYTEMVSDKALYYDNEKTVGMTDVEEQEHPLAMQIFGHDIETMVYAAKFLDEKTDCDIIDINMGCPVTKIVKSFAGSALMKDVDHAVEMSRAVVQSVKKPVTVKCGLAGIWIRLLVLSLPAVWSLSECRHLPCMDEPENRCMRAVQTGPILKR